MCINNQLEILFCQQNWKFDIFFHHWSSNIQDNYVSLYCVKNIANIKGQII